MILALLAVAALPAQASSWEAAPNVDGLAGAEVRAVEVTSDGSVWFAVRDRGLARLADGEVSWVDARDGLVSNGVAGLHEDRFGRLWAAGAGGFSVLENTEWTRHQTLGPLQPRVVFNVGEDPRDGTVWLAANGGAARQVAGGWDVFGRSDGLPHEVVHSVVVDQAGTAWLACRRGLARVEGDEITVLFPAVNFRSATAAPDGSLWFGTAEGIFTWDGASWGRHLEGNAVYPLLIPDSGTVWAGTPSSGLKHRSDAEWETIELPTDLLGAEVFDLSEAPDGSIWVATSRGAARYTPDGG